MFLFVKPGCAPHYCDNGVKFPKAKDGFKANVTLGHALFLNMF